MAVDNNITPRTSLPELDLNLPFVNISKRGYVDGYWDVPPTDDYDLACRIGLRYAAYFADYLKKHPERDNESLLCDIVKCMDFNDESCAKGYFVGFLTHLQQLVFAAAQHIDIFAYANRVDGEDLESAMFALISKHRNIDSL